MERWRPCTARMCHLGYTREEALYNIHDAVEAYIRDLRNAGEGIPQNATTQVIRGYLDLSFPGL
jgi:predicted RNase H-like HicB family nuclease